MMVLFVFLALLAIVGALGAILLPNGVHAALSMVGTLLTLAMIYFTLSAHFLAAVQVIVYAGAIMVLFLFVVMMLNAAKPENAPDPIPWVRPLAYASGAVLAVVLLVNAFRFHAPKNLADADAALAGGSPMLLGETLLTKFLLPFEAVSILLLVAVVGAVALVRREPSEQANPTLEATMDDLHERSVA